MFLQIQEKKRIFSLHFPLQAGNALGTHESFMETLRDVLGKRPSCCGLGNHRAEGGCFLGNLAPCLPHPEPSFFKKFEPLILPKPLACETDEGGTTRKLDRRTEAEKGQWEP